MKCNLTNNLLIKRRHQRATPTRAVYDIGDHFRLIYGARQLEPELLTTDRQIVRVATSLPSTFGAAQLHQTTRWSIEMLEKYYQGGRLLDVGTGAGLLAICAAQLLKLRLTHSSTITDSSIEAFDIYNDAIKQARINLRINSLSQSVQLRCADLIDYPIDSYALIIGNLPPVAITDLWRELIKRLSHNGILILSGLLRHNLPRMIEQLSTKGLNVIDRVESDLWCLLVARRDRE